ncbi:hypothetical protein G9A89_018798 [Geosiphon pyriformis]|nr:hypothetical protein G9A89_018798 [Geosiphon pyriformis]
MVAIEKKVKDQVQIFETEATLCELEEIGLVNLHIPAKNHNHIKISIYNNIGDIIKIPEETIIGYLITKIEDQLLNTIPDFLQLCGYTEQMLSAPTKTIRTDELRKSRLTSTDTAQNVTQQFHRHFCK